MLLVTALLMTGCGADGAGEQVDGHVYDTVTGLAEASDLIITGTPTEVVGREVDGGGALSGDQGVEMVFWSVAVESVLSDPQSGVMADDVVVAWPAESEGIPERASPVSEGEPLVLFLDRLEDGETPGITSVRDFYVPVGGDQGVFDVRGSEVRARSPEVRGLRRADESEGPVSVPLSELAQVVPPA